MLSLNIKTGYFHLMGAWDALWEELLSSSGEKIHNSSKGNLVWFFFFFHFLLQNNNNLSLLRRGILNTMISFNCIISWGRITTSPHNSFQLAGWPLEVQGCRGMPGASSVHPIAWMLCCFPNSALTKAARWGTVESANKRAVQRSVATSLEVCITAYTVQAHYW